MQAQYPTWPTRRPSPRANAARAAASALMRRHVGCECPRCTRSCTAAPTRTYAEPMSVVRIVPNLPVSDVTRANDLYATLFDLDVGMDLGWVGNLSPAGRSSVELQTITDDASAPCNPVISVGVGSIADLDLIRERVLAEGLEIVHPPTDEPWGVRRFFFRDPDGNVINVVAHR